MKDLTANFYQTKFAERKAVGSGLTSVGPIFVWKTQGTCLTCLIYCRNHAAPQVYSIWKINKAHCEYTLFVVTSSLLATSLVANSMQTSKNCEKTIRDSKQIPVMKDPWSPYRLQRQRHHQKSLRFVHELNPLHDVPVHDVSHARHTFATVFNEENLNISPQRSCSSLLIFRWNPAPLVPQWMW